MVRLRDLAPTCASPIHALMSPSHSRPADSPSRTIARRAAGQSFGTGDREARGETVAGMRRLPTTRRVCANRVGTRSPARNARHEPRERTAHAVRGARAGTVVLARGPHTSRYGARSSEAERVSRNNALAALVRVSSTAGSVTTEKVVGIAAGEDADRTAGLDGREVADNPRQCRSRGGCASNR